MKFIKKLIGNITYDGLIKEKQDDNMFVIKFRYASQDDNKCINNCEFTFYRENDDKNSIKGFDVYARNNDCKDKVLDALFANIENSNNILAFRYYFDNVEEDNDTDEDVDEDEDEDEYEDEWSWVYFSQSREESIEGDTFWFKIIIDSVDIYKIE